MCFVLYCYASKKRALYSYFIVTLVIKAPSVLHLIPMLVITVIFLLHCYVGNEAGCVCV